MKLTKIDEIEDLADGVPVLIVEGSIKYASEVKQGTTGKTDWSRQFFVLTSGTAEVGCTLWDALENAMKKGESVRIENTQDKKGHWSGITKGSYSKEGKLNHTLEIRAEKVKITHPNGQQGEDSTFANARTTMQQGDEHGVIEREESGGGSTFVPQSSVRVPNGEDGVTEARKHLMQSCNLLNLCIAAVNKAIAPNVPEIAQTSEFFQAQVATLFIEASRAGFVFKMPTTPVKGGKHATTVKPTKKEKYDDPLDEHPMNPINQEVPF